jgi:hypothetical protein
MIDRFVDFVFWMILAFCLGVIFAIAMSPFTMRV